MSLKSSSSSSSPSTADKPGSSRRTIARIRPEARTPPAEVFFRNAGRGLDRARIRRFARVLQGEVAGGSYFCCLIAGDAALLKLNSQFRGKDYPADVLSFPEQGPGGEIGEIAISADRAREQAASNGHTCEEEIQILMLHGVLHLLGFDHETDRGKMFRAERRWRTRLGLPCGLVERAGKR